MRLPPDFHVSVSTNNGSVPPKHRRGVRITIDASGRLEHTTSRGYSQEEATSVVSIIGEEGVTRLFEDLDALGMFSAEWGASGRKRVGGPSTWLTYTADGVTTLVPVHLGPEQARLRREIVDRIRRLLPPDTGVQRAASP